MTDKNIAKKEKAIELLKQMDIYAPYIKGFRESDKVCFLSPLRARRVLVFDIKCFFSIEFTVEGMTMLSSCLSGSASASPIVVAVG